jgi:hypothetical protein
MYIDRCRLLVRLIVFVLLSSIDGEPIQLSVSILREHTNIGYRLVLLNNRSNEQTRLSIVNIEKYTNISR